MDVTHLQAVLSMIFHTMDAYLQKMLRQLGITHFVVSILKLDVVIDITLIFIGKQIIQLPRKTCFGTLLLFPCQWMIKVSRISQEMPRFNSPHPHVTFG